MIVSGGDICEIWNVYCAFPHDLQVKISATFILRLYIMFEIFFKSWCGSIPYDLQVKINATFILGIELKSIEVVPLPYDLQVKIKTTLLSRLLSRVEAALWFGIIDTLLYYLMWQ